MLSICIPSRPYDIEFVSCSVFNQAPLEVYLLNRCLISGVIHGLGASLEPLFHGTPPLCAGIDQFRLL